MSIRFAAPVTARSPLRAIRRVRSHPRAANDNRGQPAGGEDEVLSAALRFFARHGLAAAAEARHQAEQAALNGDHDALALWRGICGTLDRRMMRELDRKLAAGS